MRKMPGYDQFITKIANHSDIDFDSFLNILDFSDESTKKEFYNENKKEDYKKFGEMIQFINENKDSNLRR